MGALEEHDKTSNEFSIPCDTEADRFRSLITITQNTLYRCRRSGVGERCYVNVNTHPFPTINCTYIRTRVRVCVNRMSVIDRQPFRCTPNNRYKSKQWTSGTFVGFRVPDRAVYYLSRIGVQSPYLSGLRLN